MSKTIKNCFIKKLTFNNMIDAHYRACKGKRHKPEIIKFEMDLESNIITMIDKIKDKRYKFGNYREFTVYEPKMRIIKSLPYPDRIVHQWYIEEFIKPYFYPRFINTTFACLDNRGTHKAAKTVQCFMRKMKRKYGTYYVLKCDIKRYFYSIDKDILINILMKRIKDKKLIEFTKVILDDGEKVGIPIGNYTSQYFANIYLNELDYYIKNTLRVKYYVRYMDDFILLLPTKKEVKDSKKLIEDYIKIHLNLSLNDKSKYFPNYHGIDFCGYRIFETHILLRKRFKRKLISNINKWQYLYNHQKLNRDKFKMSLRSLKGHAVHANSYNLMVKFEDKVNNIFNESTNNGLQFTATRKA